MCSTLLEDGRKILAVRAGGTLRPVLYHCMAARLRDVDLEKYVGVAAAYSALSLFCLVCLILAAGGVQEHICFVVQPLLIAVALVFLQVLALFYIHARTAALAP